MQICISVMLKRDFGGNVYKNVTRIYYIHPVPSFQLFLDCLRHFYIARRCFVLFTSLLDSQRGVK